MHFNLGWRSPDFSARPWGDRKVDSTNAARSVCPSAPENLWAAFLEAKANRGGGKRGSTKRWNTSSAIG
jgi:hypothetical protein